MTQFKPHTFYYKEIYVFVFIYLLSVRFLEKCIIQGRLSLAYVGYTAVSIVHYYTLLLLLL